MGWMNSVGKFLGENKDLLAQYLAGAGTDLSTTGRLGTNFNSVTKNASASKNMMKVIQGMLGGDIPQGSSITHDGKGSTIKLARITPEGQPGPNPGDNAIGQIPDLNSVLQMLGEGEETQTPAVAPAQMTPLNPVVPAVIPQPAAQPQMNSIGRLRDSFNPFAGSRSFSVNDLAGLTPQELIQVVQMKQQQDQNEVGRYNANVDAEYKLGVMRDYYNGELTAKQAQQKLEEYQNKTNRMNAETNQVEAGTKLYSALTKDERTASIKEYEYAKEQGFKGTLEDWNNIATPETIKLFNKSVEDKSWDVKKKGGLWNFIRAKNEAGAPRFTPYETKTQTDQASREGDVQDPKFNEDVEKRLMAERDDWDYLPETSSYAKENKGLKRDEIDKYNAKWQRVYLIRAMDYQIRQAFVNKKVEMKKDGWYVDGKLTRRMP
jgi:hypothetical protein